MFEEFEWRQYLLELHEAVAIYFSLYRLKVQYMFSSFPTTPTPLAATRQWANRLVSSMYPNFAELEH